MSTDERCRIGERSWLARQDDWHTTSALMISGADALVSGPGFDTETIAALAADAGLEIPATVHLLVTHMDFDHLRGIGMLPEARVVAGAGTAAKLADDGERGRYEAMAAAAGTPWRGPPRVDRAVEPPAPVRCGEQSVAALALPGHTSDSVGYYSPEFKLLLPGDYLSVSSYPMITAGLTPAIATHGLLLATLEENDVRWVVPGHGPAMDALGAARVAREDLDYLRALAAAIVEADGRGLDRDVALETVRRATSPPRAATGGFETLDMHEVNARRGWEAATR